MVLCAVLALSLLTAFIGAGTGGSAAAADVNPPRKIAIVVIDRIGLDDLLVGNTPNISRLIEEGTVALMNARVRNDAYGRGGYVIIGAGGRAIGGPNAGLAFNEGERLKASSGEYIRASALFKARTGVTAPPGSVVNLYIEEMDKKSDSPQSPGVPGLFGWALSKGSKHVTVLGNADLLAPTAQLDATYQVESPDQSIESSGYFSATTILHREISCIAMDTRGIVPTGNVSSNLYVDDTTGVMTDFEKLIGEAAEALPGTDILVVDMGQTTRVDDQAQFYSESSLTRARADALAECDRALGELVDMLDLSRDLVVICAPTPTKEMISEGNLLTPIVMTGSGFEGGVCLDSQTTRRVGVVSSFDLAPSLIESLGLDVPAEMDGGTMAPSDSGADLDGLKNMQDQAVGASGARKALVRIFAVVTIIAILLFMIAALLAYDCVTEHSVFFSIVFFSLLSVPLAYLLLPSLGVPALSWLLPSAVGASLFLGLLLALITSLGKERSGPAGVAVPSLWAISGLTALVILIDTSLGSPLMKLSPFGTDVMLGDRYYGISNLYMGFAVGASLLFACLTVTMFSDKLTSPLKRGAAVGLILGATAFIIGFGRLGANSGGLITALAGSLVAMFKLEGARIGFKRAVLIVAFLLLIVIVVVAVDIFLPGAASHTGRAAAGIEGEGGSTLVNLASRKLAANWSLSFASIWRLVLIIGLIAFLLVNWKSHLMANLKERVPAVYACFLGMGSAIVVGWLLNDSGIEVAAAISVFLFIPYFIMHTWVPRPEA